MDVQREIVRGITVLKVTGDVIETKARPLTLFKEITEAFAQYQSDILVDLSDVERCDPTGIEQLVASLQFTKECRRKLRICGANERITRKLTTMQLHKYLGQPDAKKKEAIDELAA